MSRSLALLMLAAVVFAAQDKDKPDFSGRWILASGEQSGSDIPRALSVRQSLVRTTVRGEPMPPFFKDIAVAREFESGARSDTYAIGQVGGNVPGLRADGSRSGPTGYHAVKWDEHALVFESASDTGEIPETGVWTERREVWSLEPDGRLRLTITTRSSIDAPRTVTLTYRRS
jgi:hypothetical protein